MPTKITAKPSVARPIPARCSVSYTHLDVYKRQDHVRGKNSQPTLLIGHDTRFFADEFTLAAATVLRERGVSVLLCDAPAPTPAIAYEIRRRKLDGAINFTASHNPAEYQGLKFSGADGAPSMPEVTKDIEVRAKKLAKPPRVHVSTRCV